MGTLLLKRPFQNTISAQRDIYIEMIKNNFATEISKEHQVYIEQNILLHNENVTGMHIISERYQKCP